MMLVVLIMIISIDAPLRGALFLGMLTLAIVLHELGHAWGYYVQGIPVKRVVIYGGGGFVEGTRSATDRQTEFIVAMGPLVNLALWAVCGLLAQTIGNGMAASILSTFALLNLLLFAFNMIPVQPLDGGKLFHLGMKRLFKPMRALKITGAVGLFFSVLWYPAMLFLIFTVGWFLLFLPSIRLHYEMYKAGGGRRLN
ncbi:MAG: site-2 protease family protein [Pseudomonadota bacterium]